MKLKNILFVVKNIEISKTFYREIFGLQVIADFGENVVLSEGLVLQARKVWEDCIDRKVRLGGNDTELYFEENDIDGFLERLEQSPFSIEYLNHCTTHDWGQRVIRFYDPDLHVIEVGESMEFVARRFLKSGMSVEATARKTRLPLADIRAMAEHQRGGEETEELHL